MYIFLSIAFTWDFYDFNIPFFHRCRSTDESKCNFELHHNTLSILILYHIIHLSYIHIFLGGLKVGKYVYILTSYFFIQICQHENFGYSKFTLSLSQFFFAITPTPLSLKVTALCAVYWVAILPFFDPTPFFKDV